MTKAEELFNEIADILMLEKKKVSVGKMMSSPGMMYGKKNFAFYYNDLIVFKLGKGYEIEKHGITDYEFLSPFKTKGPMTAWFEVGYKYHDKWEELARTAMKVMAEKN